jgi:quercetin dioxygenase-like cupin family protein
MYVRVAGPETGGAYSVMEHIFPPGSGPAFLHTHPAQETVLIREGTFEFYSKGPRGKESVRAGPGDVQHVESRGAHGLKNVGPTDGRAFIVFHPADLQEQFFYEFDELFSHSSGPPDPARLEALFARHGLVLLERPPAR